MMYPQAVSHGNVLSFTPPGFKQVLNVKFPDCRLAVCERCKKNYKTRDMCRVRNGHTDKPWSTAYICITLDDSCTDPVTKKYVDAPLTVRMVQWQPYCIKKPFDGKTPVCAACKKTNRTRSFCRERHQHRQLPWCTVYVILSAVESTDPNTVVAAPSRRVSCTVVDDATDKAKEGGEGAGEIKAMVIKSDPEQGNITKNEQSDSTPAKTSDENTPSAEGTGTAGIEGKANGKSPKGKNESSNDTDDINDIDETSRTFLAKVSCYSSSIHWLELTEYDAASHAAAAGSTGVMLTNAAATQGTMMVPTMMMLPNGQVQYLQQAAAVGTAPGGQHQPVLMAAPMDAAQQNAAAQYYAQMGMQIAWPATGQAQPQVVINTAAQQQAQLQMQQQHHFLQMQAQQQAASPQAGNAPASLVPSTPATPVSAVAADPNQQQHAAAVANPQQWQAQIMYQQQLFQQQQQQLYAQQQAAAAAAGGAGTIMMVANSMPGQDPSTTVQQGIQQGTVLNWPVAALPLNSETVDCDEPDAKRVKQV